MQKSRMQATHVLTVFICFSANFPTAYNKEIFPVLQRTNTENWTQIFPEKELHGHSPNFHIHNVSVSDLYIPRIDLPNLLQEIFGPILGIYKSHTDA
jgi:hypothetical protein